MNPRGRILMVNHRFAVGGSPSSLLDLALALRERGWEVVVAGGEDGPVATQIRERGFAFHLLPRRGPAALGTVADYLSLVRKERIDLVHLNTLTSYFKYPALAAVLGRVPCVWWSRENLDEKRCRRLLPWMRLLSDHVVVVSSEQGTQLQGCIPEQRRSVIFKGLDLARTEALGQQGLPPRMADDLPVVLMVGRAEPRKGLDTLVEAAAQLKREGRPVRVVVVGDRLDGADDFRTTLREQVKRAGLEDLVLPLGPVANPHPCYRRADLLVLPTHWDCAPRAIMEAMAHGCPVVATDIPGNHDLVRDGETAMLFPPGDAAACARAIRRTLDESEATRERVRRARQHLEAGFQIDLALGRVDQLYQDLLARRTPEIKPA